MKHLTRNIIFVSLAIMIAVILAALYLFNKQHPDLTGVRADYVMTAQDLYTDFESDEQAATLKYADKIIQVTGTVAVMETNADGTVNVTLGDENMFGGVICTFQGVSDPADLGLTPSAEVIIKGVCSGMLMDVLLNNCVIVSE
jgi:hypothetical protein